MSLSKTDIITQNIIRYSADAQTSATEIDLLLDELISDIDFTHKSIPQLIAFLENYAGHIEKLH